MDIDEWSEWRSQLQELLELNPEKYRKLRGILGRTVENERKLADPDIRILLELLRIRFVPTEGTS